MKETKTKQLTIRVTTSELKQINDIRLNYQKNGLNLNRSKIVRDILLNLDKV